MTAREATSGHASALASAPELAESARSPAEAQTQAPGRRRVVAVVGAGRSGTSTLTRGLAALGIDLGDRLRGPEPKNPKGFFGDKDLRRINRRLRYTLGLKRGGGAVDVAEGWDAPAVRALRDEAVALLRQRLGASPVWGFKSGSMQLLPFWQAVFEKLDLEAGYVLALRNPLSVAHSHVRLGTSRALQEKSDLNWLARVVPNFRRMAASPFVVVDYDRLLTDPRRELRRLARALDLPVTAEAEAGIETYAQEFVDGGLRHSVFGPDDLDASPRLSPVARDAYRCLLRLASDEWTPDSRAFWQEWERVEAGWAALRPVLAYIDTLEAALRRAPEQRARRFYRGLRRRLGGQRRRG